MPGHSERSEDALALLRSWAVVLSEGEAAGKRESKHP
jgi:hypothetical protein